MYNITAVPEINGVYSIRQDPNTGNVLYSKGPTNQGPSDATFRSIGKTIKVREINYKSGKVQFFKRSNLLDSIRVLDAEGDLLRSIVFFLSPWNKYPLQGDPNDRLRLDSLVFKGTDSKVIERYSFDYNPSNEMNYREIKHSDPWGYYQGPGNNSLNSLSKRTITITEGSILGVNPPIIKKQYQTSIGMEHTSNHMYSQSFMLNKIHYPTGGSVQFEYESNQYKDNQVVKNAGGLRIKSIKSYKDNTSIVAFEKSYKYGEKEDGEGFINLDFINPDYHTYEQMIIYYKPDVIFQDRITNMIIRLNGLINETKRTFVSKNLVNLSFTAGTPTIYNTVTEYQKDNGTLTGKTVYRFDYDKQAAQSELQYIGYITLQRDLWPRGALLSEINYAYKDKKFTWVHKMEMGYKDFVKDSVYVGKAFPRNILIKPSDILDHEVNHLEDIIYFNYRVKSGCKLTVSKNEYTRDIRDTTRILSTSTSYHYDNPNSVFSTREVFTDSYGDTYTTYTIHPNDYHKSDPIMGWLQNSNIISPNVEIVKTVKKAGETQPKVINARLSRYSTLGYRLSEHEVESSIPLNQSEFKFSLVPIGLLPDNLFEQYTFQPSTLYKTKRDYNYDANGNLNQTITNGLVKTSYLWGYKNLYPVAEVKNAVPNEILFLNFEYKEPQLYNTSGIVSSVFHTGKACYDLSFGVLTKAGLSVTTNYHLSYWTRNPLAYAIVGTIGIPNLHKSANGWNLFVHKVSGRSNIAISGTGYIDDLRIHPENAIMLSYTYDPSIGMTSETDGNGMVVYYTYDAAGRLNLVKDQAGNILKQYKYRYSR